MRAPPGQAGKAEVLAGWHHGTPGDVALTTEPYFSLCLSWKLKITLLSGWLSPEASP